MRPIFRWIFALLLSGYCNLFAQTPSDIAVQVHATAQTAPPSITLHWPADANASGYNIYRKLKGSSSWSPVGAVTGTDSTFTDLAVAVGDAWEYRLTKTATGYTGQGYCYAGIELAVQDYFGKVILVVDTTYAAGLATELWRLEEDLWGDGWQVIRIDVDRNDLVPDVKARIQNEWQADPVNVRSVFLFGHVPVPYSGNLNPDGHGDHQGAWPADVYYGEMDGAWTDQSVNNTTATRPQNDNTIGDGKFDQTTIPGSVELEVGRVDFANMPTFTVGEETLLRRYLEKDHAWRHKHFTVPDSGVVDDNFGYFGGEAFAANSWRNFPPMIGAHHAYSGDFRLDLNARDHLWAYGCGGGWYQGANGVGSTTDFAGDSLRGVFTMIFGSYHGDWDSDDNFMRAALATKGHILSCAWAGRPNWHFLHMGLGEPIGYSARLTQNNFNTYITGYGARFVHIALMGDPTVRMHQLAPPGNLVVTAVNGGTNHELNWTASVDVVSGYAIYRQDTLGGRYLRIGTVNSGTTIFTDSCRMAGDYRYMVRAEELRTGYSGSYHNLSQGVFDTISNAMVYAVQTSNFSPAVYCPGDTVLIPFTTVDSFCTGNVFTAEISDSTGSFALPVAIGNLSGQGQSGIVVGVLPPGTLPAVGYRVRVNASHPFAMGLPNVTDLTVLGMPSANFSFVQNGLSVSFTDLSANATSWNWSFGDGNTSMSASPTHAYAGDGSFTVQLIASNACGSDTLAMNLTVVGMEEAMYAGLKMAPNPADHWFEIWESSGHLQGHRLLVRDIVGKEMYAMDFNGSVLHVETGNWARGTYLVEVTGPQGNWRRRLVLE
jgi:hypothetical protein